MAGNFLRNGESTNASPSVDVDSEIASNQNNDSQKVALVEI
jgi:hypothetical protein